MSTTRSYSAKEYDLDILTPRQEEPSSSSSSSSSTKLNRNSCRKHFTCQRWLLVTSLPFLIFWTYFLYIGITQGLQFLDHTHWSLEPPKGSPSLVAKEVAHSYFSQKGYQYALSQAVLIVSKDPTGPYPVTHPAVANLTRRVLNNTLGSCDDLPRHNGECWWRDALGIYVHDEEHPVLYEDSDFDFRADFLSDDNVTATFILLNNNDGFGAAGNPQQKAAWSKLQDCLDEWSIQDEWGAHYDVSTTHEQMLLYDSEKGVIGDFEHGDMITLPIAWFILLLSCGPSAVLVLFTLPVTLLGVFYILDQIALGHLFPIIDTNGNSQRRVDFPSFTPAIFINMIIAISLDYGLFMLTRYREEIVRLRNIKNNRSNFWLNLEAVAVSTSRAGRVVLISGVTLGLTMVGLTLCTVTVVAAIGWGGAAACALSVLVHLTMLPALLVVLGSCCCLPLIDYRCTSSVCCRATKACASMCNDICCCFKSTRVPCMESHIEVSSLADSLFDTSGREYNAALLGSDGSESSIQSGRSDRSDQSGRSDGSDGRKRRRRRRTTTTGKQHNKGVMPTRGSMYVPSTESVSMWIRLGEWCRDHRLKVTLLMCCTLAPFVYLCTQAKVSVNQELLTPSNSVALQSMKDITKYPGLNAGWLNPIIIIVYNPYGGPSSPFGTISPPCHDDDLDLRQLLDQLHDEKFDPKNYPPSLLTCSNLKSFGVGICEKKMIDGHNIEQGARTFCPGTCSKEYCNAYHNPQNRTVLVESLFEEIDSFRHLIHQKIPKIELRNIRSVTTVPFQPDVHVDAKAAFSMLNGPPARSTPYQAAFQRYTNYNQTALEIQIILPMGQSCGGSGMLRTIRQLAKSVQPTTKYGFLVYGDIPVLLDSVDEVFKESPPIVGLVTLVVVFVMAGLAFQSCLIPLRLLGTVIVTLIFVSGSTVLMYQYILGYDGIYWFVPICTACLVVGLTIDYDVFLIRYVFIIIFLLFFFVVIFCYFLKLIHSFPVLNSPPSSLCSPLLSTHSRIYEFRLQGYTTEASILRAMGKQSTTITTAGIIMTMAFSSLLLSKTVVLNQFGFVLVAASLIDTFIVRTLLVPSLMFIAVETNWWPGSVPEATRDDLVDGEPTRSGDGKDPFFVI